MGRSPIASARRAYARRGSPLRGASRIHGSLGHASSSFGLLGCSRSQREDPMSDPDVWREKAAMLRHRAGETDETDRRRVLLTLAEDCDQMAADLEGDDALEVG